MISKSAYEDVCANKRLEIQRLEHQMEQLKELLTNGLHTKGRGSEQLVETDGAMELTRERVVLLVERHDAQLPPKEQAILRWLNRLGPEAFFQLLEVKRADNMGQTLEKVGDRLAELDEIRAKAKQILVEGQCLTLKDLAVDGRDVMAAGIAPGPAVGQVLDGLLERLLSGEIPNERDALLNWIAHNKNGGQRQGAN